MKIRSLFKKWWFWTLFLILVVVGVSIIFRPKESTRYVTEEAELTNLVQTVDANGEVESIDQVNLAFDLSGEVAEVFVEVGQTVEAGTLLAKLDTTELQADVQSAFQAVQYAKANLEKQRAGAAEEVVAVSQANVGGAEALRLSAETEATNAQAILEATKNLYAADVSLKQASVSTAEDNLLQVKADNAQDLSNAYRDLLSSVWAGVIGARNATSEADSIIGVRDGFANDDFESVLSARNKGALTSAKDAFYAAEKTRDAAESAVVGLTYDASYSTIKSSAELVERALTDAAILLLYTRQVVDATLNTSDFTVSDLAALKTSIDATRAAIQADQAALENSFQALETAIDANNEGVQDAQNALNEAKASLTYTQAFSDQQIKSSENALATSLAGLAVRQADVVKAKASLSEVKAAPRQIDLASFQAEVARTSAAYQASLARLAKAEIVSPIDGEVTDIQMEVGEQVVASTSVLVVQTTEEQFQIVADISESDITKVDINDIVELTFDAYSDDIVVQAFIGEIDPAEKLIEGVVYYRATVYLTETIEQVELRPGLSADLVILTDHRSDVLSVPQRAVLEREGKKYVRILVNSNPVEKEVQTGLRADMGRVEIISGIEEGDQVIIREIHE